MYKHLSIEEREYVQQGLWKHKSLRTIAKELNRQPSSISREIERNLPPERFLYTPRLSHERALKKRKSRGRADRLKNDTIREYVISHLKLRWSPEQISNRLRKDIPHASISHEAIYQYIYHQIHRDGWGLLRPGCQDLRTYLRRRKKRRTHKGQRRCQRIFKPKGVSINERPVIVSERGRLGDWEGDTVESISHKPGVNTLVERKTGVVLITKLKNKTSRATTEAISFRMSALPERAKYSLTMDNGPENQGWQTLEEKTGLKTFFANAYHSWERGTNENTNGLIRDYFPKKTDFSMVSEEKIQQVEYLLNTRPRKRFGWLTPLEAFSKELIQFNVILNMPGVALAG
jgi:IS30 family transposase